MKDIFLCHTGADKDWVRTLAERLERERIGGRTVEVWLDEWDVDYGESIIGKIDEGLRTSRFVGVVLSPAAARAGWPNAEWQSQIMADPVNKAGRIIPLLRHKFDPETGEPIDLPFVFRTLKWVDFTDDRRFDVALARLLTRLSGQRPTRGRGGLGAALPTLAMAGRDAPDVVQESLPSNLLPVLSLPEALYGDVTTAHSKSDIWKQLTGARVPPFVLHAGRLYSFYRPTAADNPFKHFLVGTDGREERTADWLRDPDLARQLIGMLNAALREHCYHLRIRSPKDDRSHFYCPMFDGKDRTFRWGEGYRVRTLSKLKTRVNGMPFGVHMSAYLRFIVIGGRIFLIVEPAWLFTTDGITPLEGSEVGKFSTKWNGPERNATVLRNVLMWGLLLGEGTARIRISVGSGHLIIQSVPAHTQINVGLESDVVRLDRILGGAGAGETSWDEVTNGADELDVVADLALSGALVGEDTEPGNDRVSDETETEDLFREDGLTGPPELPF